MKTSVLTILFASFAIALTTANNKAAKAEVPCATAFDDGFSLPVVPKNMEWRSAFTNPSQVNTFIKSSKSREENIKDSIKDMENDVLVNQTTPGMGMIPIDKINEKALVEIGDYGSGIIGKYKVSKLGSGGVYKASMLLPVSGHVGVENAKRWATTDTYSIIVESGGQRTVLVKDAKSKDIVTVQEIEIPLIKGVPVRVMYNRSGSLGPSGFAEGRALDLVWDGT